MFLNKITKTLENFILNHFISLVLTILLHLLLLFLLVFIELRYDFKKELYQIAVEIEDILEDINKLEERKGTKENENKENLKNIPKDLAEKEKSFDDYYKEAKNLLSKIKIEDYTMENYEDKRILIKDYSYEMPDIKDWDKPLMKEEEQETKKTYKGYTTVEYDLGGRKHRKLKIPAYQCETSGKVKLKIFVNKNGIIKKYELLEIDGKDKECMLFYVKEAIRYSTFLPDYYAPDPHIGTLTYYFSKQ